MTPFRLVLIALTFLLTACAAGTVPPGAATTVIALRHGDKAGEQLSPQGRDRAAALPAALADYDIDAIYSTSLQRNVDTATPLSNATGLPIIKIASEKVAARITRDYPDSTVVWVGNKGNLVTLWEDLKAPGDPPLEYGDLFVVTMENGAARDVRRMHFGD